MKTIILTLWILTYHIGPPCNSDEKVMVCADTPTEAMQIVFQKHVFCPRKGWGNLKWEFSSAEVFDHVYVMVPECDQRPAYNWKKGKVDE